MLRLHNGAVVLRLQDFSGVWDDVSRRVPRLPSTQRQPEVPTVLALAARRRLAAVYGQGRRPAQVSYDKINNTWQRVWFLLRIKVMLLFNDSVVF